MQRKRILDIQQFEGIRKMTGNNRDPFVNCLYTPILSVVNYFKMSSFPIIANPFFYYEHISKIAYPTGYLRVRIEHLNDLDFVLKKMGIEITYYTPSPENLLNFIRENIEYGSPILVNIDMYYQKGRKEYYLKKHDGKHAILVYGYNDINKTINFLDDFNGYSEYVMSYEDIFVYYKGLFDYCNISDNKNATTRVFTKSSFNNFNQKENMLCQVKEFSLKMLNDKYRILNNLENLRNFQDIQHSIKNDEAIISALTSTVQRKTSQKYQYLILGKYGLYPENYKREMENSIDIIVNNWTLIRNIIAKSVYKDVYLLKTKESVIEYIEDIYEKEKLFYTLLFSIMDE
ncbi:BtrH N-terminal domain-containing protein [Metabacillus halosaccharovorans]|uniref:BtrH N-terminal domain-containing protein n=1 Tax=Metabacillus halosaccharovorans TaxID=930124 RepID=UPI00204155C9|nr:BtrH N-terminal domain-containing protein [Metabacillus halosaccharovorans]MCM3443675.1 BtrH N-terminal domain-containing protein [Metabacillus halosaccharovorans]